MDAYEANEQMGREQEEGEPHQTKWEVDGGEWEGRVEKTKGDMGKEVSDRETKEEKSTKL